MYGIYVHIPFCIQKCPYCDFNSYANKLYLADEYINALLNEAKQYKGIIADTVFIGGGTPTCIPQNLLTKLLDNIFNIFNIADNAEITMEANPGTINKKLLNEIKNVGINRLSIGAQSLKPEILKKIGRIHTPQDFFDGVDMAREVGFENISADMMFGLPSQTMNDWEQDVKAISKMPITHVSCYSLKIEEGTPFYTQGITPPSDELDRDMYHKAVDILANNGYKRYEISNFSKSNYESRHNLKYWQCEEYIGVGAGAHSFKDNKRYSNIKGVEEYISAINKGNLAIDEQITLTPKDVISEKIFLGLRLDKGVSREIIKEFENYEKILDKLQKNMLIYIDNNTVKLTEKGIDLSNQVFMEFI